MHGHRNASPSQSRVGGGQESEKEVGGTDGIKKWQWHTRRQANTGLNMTLKGILIADIACRGLANWISRVLKAKNDLTVGRRSR
jgi:hypothetical protein